MIVNRDSIPYPLLLLLFINLLCLIGVEGNVTDFE